ncbi:MAG: PqqD family peptide modification chaperone [Mycobacteriales bacterium]
MTPAPTPLLDAAPRHASGTTLREDADGAHWLSGPHTTDEYLLNPTAFALWELCDGETTGSEMVLAVYALFGAEMAQIRRDVTNVLSELSRADLLDWPAGSMPAPHAHGGAR